MSGKQNYLEIAHLTIKKYGYKSTNSGAFKLFPSGSGEQTHIYVGGAGSCAGCGEGTALRMLCSATGAKYGNEWGIIAATGCNTVYTSTYPYNPYLVPWTNSLFVVS